MEKDPSLIWLRCEQIGDGYGLKCKKHRIIPKGILTACYNNLHLSICTDEAIKEVRQFRQILFCRKMPYTGTVFFEEYLKMRSEAEEKLFKQIEKIRGADADAMRDAAAYVQSLAAPPGSLGKLTDAAVQLAGITGRVKNTLDRRRIIVMCADNGVVAEGVSSTPPIVTLSQALNMTRHLTGMSSLARHFGCEVEVVDIGIATPYQGKDSGILQCRIRRGTGNIANEPALSREEAVAAILGGIERALQASKDGVDVIGVGEMGIGNTTTSSAVLAALTDLSVENVTGRGGGLTDAAFAKKKKVIARALELHGLKSISAGEADTVNASENPDPIDVIAKVGGLDIAAMCGVFLGAALYRLPVVIDGFISIVAALCAQRLCGIAREYMFPSHVSEEIGYMRAAEELCLDPWLHMNMRLGEGSGCPLAFQILEASCALMNEMATFEQAKIDDGYLAELRAMQS